jgi:hypothetical protein
MIGFQLLLGLIVIVKPSRHAESSFMRYCLVMNGVEFSGGWEERAECLAGILT